MVIVVKMYDTQRGITTTIEYEEKDLLTSGLARYLLVHKVETALGHLLYPIREKAKRLDRERRRKGGE